MKHRFELTRFPYDIQNVRVRLILQNYNTSLIELNLISYSFSDPDFFMPNSGWEA